MKKSYSEKDKINALIGSWLAAFIYGVALLIAAGLITGLLIGSFGKEAKASATFFSILLLLITLTWLALIPFRKYYFGRYFRYAMISGMMVVLGLVFTSLQLAIKNSQNIDTTCSSLTEQLDTARASTYPIATDKGQGTAFAIDDKGTLLTAYHVVKGADKVYISYTSGEIPVKVVKVSAGYDLALLKTKETTEDFLNLTSSYDTADPLYALGYPESSLSAGQASVSSGILSRVLDNSDLRLNYKDTPKGLEVVQTDAALNPGNSGGPIFNKCGVVGVIDAKSDSLQLQEYGISSEEGISFAISSKTAAKKFGILIYSE